MKKIIIFLFCLFTFLAYSAGGSCVFAQSYFFNDTAGTVTKRITALESTNYSNTFFSGKQYITITGYASGDIDFSIGDSLFTGKTSVSFGSGKAILIHLVWLPKYAVPMIWMKSASGSINVDIQIRTF